MAYKFRSNNESHHLVLEQFGGVDFTSNQTGVLLSRSPDMRNMIADGRYFPVKRSGYKRINKTPVEGVNRLFRYVTKAGDTVLLAHCGTKLYTWTIEGEPKEIYGDMIDGSSSSFMMNGLLYLLTGKEYLQYDGETVTPVSQIAYTPTTSIGRKPDSKEGNAGGGTAFDGVNMLCTKRINTLTADGESKTWTLDATDIKSVNEVKVLGEVVSNYTADLKKGKITFLEPPPDDNGIDSIEVTFEKVVEGQLETINSCTICGIYGGKNDTRVFVSGNKEKRNMDFASGVYDPTYFPDNEFAKIGSDNSAIVGYLKQYDTQIILKEGNDQDATIFMRSSGFDGENRQYFPVMQGIAGSSIIAPNSFVILEDTPLFLTKDGVYTIVGNDVQKKMTLANRSYLVDKKLLMEKDLKNAVATEYEGKYILCVNGNCYVADSKQPYGDRQSQGYEWYFWDNIPAACFLEHDGRLYFGSAKGMIYRFYKPEEKGAYLDDGAAIKAHYTTPLLNFGTWSKYKTVKNVHVVALAYLRSGIEVYYSTEEALYMDVMKENIDLFSFDDLDFNRFSFRTIQAPIPYATGTKERKIIFFQVTVKNERENEPMGFLAIDITYKVGGKVK